MLAERRKFPIGSIRTWGDRKVKKVANGQWVEVPSDETEVMLFPKSRGISRKDMPQITKKHTEDFIRWLDHKGVRTDKIEMKAKNLQPTQKHLDYAKARRLSVHAERYKKEPIFVSKDGFVFDGHHRWAAIQHADRDASMQVYRVNATIDQMLALADKYPHTQRAGLGEGLRGLVSELRSPCADQP